MTEMNLAADELAQELAETVQISRLSGNTEVDVATDVELIIQPNTTRGDQIGIEQNTQQGYYTGYMLTPNPAIRKGDIITTASSSPSPDTLFVDGPPFQALDVQWFNLTTVKRR